MKPGEVTFTRFLRSRPFALLLIGLSLAGSLLSRMSGAATAVAEGAARGLWFDPPARWLGSELHSWWAALGVAVATMIVMAKVNGRFNSLRTPSWLFVAMFAVMEAGSPGALTVLAGGQIAALTMMLCIGMMFSVCQRAAESAPKVFLVFCLAGAGMMFQYGFALFIPIFVVGCILMRVMSFKRFVAILLGLVTPLWIAFGLGFADPLALRLPEFRLPGTFDPDMLRSAAPLLAASALAILTGVGLSVVNLFKIFTFNARLRALNGLPAAAMLLTAVAAVADWPNLSFYLPSLNMLAAYQIGLFFRIRLNSRGYLLITVLMPLYIALWIWQILI